MASLKFRHYATERALIGSGTLQVALNAMDVGDIVFIDDTQTQYIITSKNNNVVTYSTYYGKAAITGVTGTGASRTLTFSNGSEITITINNVEHAITSESCSGNANSATTLQNTRKINGTNFNGSADITTNNWGASRNIGIVNSDGSGTAIPVSINGSNNINLKLPSTIKANLEGNASTANTAISAGSATSDSNGNVIASTYLPLSGGTMTGTIIVDNYTAFGPTGGNFYLGTPKYPLLLRSSGTTTINGNTLLHSGNFNSYAPKLDGTGANGTWGINVSGNAATATKLATSRTIWGHNFDGTGNVKGALSGVTTINSTLYFDSSGNVGIGTASPSYKLYVNGDGYFVDNVITESDFSSRGDAIIDGTVSCYKLSQASDIKYKTNIKQIEYEEALKIIENLNPVTWDWNENTVETGSSSGFVAQEAEEFIPNAISRDNENNLSLDYTQLHSYEIRVIQEQQKEIIKLKEKLKILEKLIS